MWFLFERFPLPLCAWDGLRYFIVALSEPFIYLFRKPKCILICSSCCLKCLPQIKASILHKLRHLNVTCSLVPKLSRFSKSKNIIAK